MKSPALLHSVTLCTLLLPIHHTLWNENGTEPPPQPISVCEVAGETCRSHCRFRLMAYMWFSNQAARKHTRAYLLSVNRRRRYPLIILVKGNMVLFDTLSHSLPFHHHMLKLFSAADVQMFLYMILCLSVTIDIVWKMGWGNLHALFHWGLETCLAGRNLCCRSSPYGRWQ